MYCSIKQAVSVWDDLRDAMEGKSGFGGFTAEIYAYRLMPCMPKMVNDNFGFKYQAGDMLLASTSLIQIIEMFIEKYHNGTFEINELSYKAWHIKYGSKFDHRVHVKFIPKKH